jgi:hypothetical protein
MKFLKDGNIAPWARALIWIVGLLIVFLFYKFATGKIMFLGVVIGMVVAAIGAFAEKANALKLKPFSNSYKKARESYDSHDQTPKPPDEKG